jgi:hypothetical protein
LGPWEFVQAAYKKFKKKEEYEAKLSDPKLSLDEKAAL